MKKLLAAVIGLLCVFSYSAQAGEFGELEAKIGAARTAAITMLMHKDQRGAAQQKTAKDTSDAARAALAKLKAPAGKESQFNEMKELTTAFLDTRENEVIPAILKGNDEEAKKLLTGIQKERFGKIAALLDMLGK